MAANTNALQSFSVREAPWWDQDGKSVKDRYPETIAEAMEWSGTAGWDAIAEPVYKLLSIDENGREVYQKLAKSRNITRSDDGSVELGSAGSKWEAIPNRTPFELIAHILDQRPLYTDADGVETVPHIGLDTKIFADLGIRIETGGYLGSGELLWVCGKLDDAVVLPGDFSTTDMFVVATMANDGTGALKAFSTLVRAVCQNTIKAGEMQAEANNSIYRFKHTASWREKLEVAKKVIKGSLEQREKLAAIYEELSAITVDEETVDDFIDTLVPLDPRATKRARTNVLNDRATIRTMLASPTTLPVADKALGLWLAGGEFFDHGRRYRTQSSYVKRTLIDPQEGKLIALDILHGLTGANVGRNATDKTLVGV